EHAAAVPTGPSAEPGHPGAGTNEEEPPLVVPPDEEGPRAVGGLEGPRPVVDDELPGAVAALGDVPADEPAPAEVAPPVIVEEAPTVLGDATPLPVDDTGVEIDVAPAASAEDDEIAVTVEGDEELAAPPPVPGPEPEAMPAPEPAPEAIEAGDAADAVEVVEVEPEAVDEVPAASAPPPLPVHPGLTPSAPPPPAAERGWPALDAELEELEFYERQGLREEALLAAQELAAAHPGHPALPAILARVEAMSGEWSGSSEAAPVQPHPAGPAAGPEPSAPSPPGTTRTGSTGTTGIFDLGAELSAELGPELTPSPSGEFQYSVADVFDQFKRGLERTVRPDDSATKYDLGIAFQEMGMLDEALEQFRSALAGGDRHREVEILSMIGNCLGLKGDHAGAVEAYRQALHSEFLTGPAAKAIHFELGAAHEALGEPDVALWYFQKIAHGDPAYRGVGGRVTRLGGGPGRPPGEAPPQIAGATPRE
ncbi:MAG TPA: tetratricopeptide repeat protein, partial [Anaeromyxobacteraceae bacterium]|nr:tetratricopeptide repeat protein [Anaeromyxobacteraceae bacterium]